MQDLINRGVRKGMRVAFPAPTTPSTVETLIALWHLGAIACPLNPRLPEKAYAQALRRLEPVFALDRQDKAQCEVIEHPKDLSVLLLTSGTSSEPKIVGLSHHNLAMSAKGASVVLPLTNQDAWRISLPLFHVSGLGIVMRCLLSGAQMKFGTSQATHLSLVPTQLYRLLEENSPDLFNAKAIVVGGGPTNSTLLEKALAKNLPIYTTWGMTETSSMVTLGLANQTNHSGSILPYRELKIDASGEILVKGATLFQGYLKDQEFHLPTDHDGWFATRDLGSIDTEGRLYWKGRKDNLFTSYGENIQPEEIEAILLRLPSIEQAIVVPVPHPEYGAVPVAFLTTTASIDPEALKLQLKEELPSFKIPHRFLPLEDDALKPSRALLAQQAAK